MSFPVGMMFILVGIVCVTFGMATAMDAWEATRRPVATKKLTNTEICANDKLLFAIQGDTGYIILAPGMDLETVKTELARKVLSYTCPLSNVIHFENTP